MPRHPSTRDKTSHSCVPKYLSYKDLPPPSPQEREILRARLEALYKNAHRHYEAERRSELLRWVDFAP